MRGMFLSVLIGSTLAGCLSSTTPPVNEGTGGSGSGGMATPGTGGSNGSGGASSSGGSTGSGGMTVLGTGGMSSGSGGNNSGSGGTSQGTGGDTGSGGMTAAGGRGGGSGGRAATGGATGSGGGTGTGGMGTGGAVTGGATGAAVFPMALRVDDPCSSLLGGNVCLHQGKTSDNGTPFTKMASVNLGGTPGTMYQVKIHVRGVVEPTHITGGTPGTPPQFVAGGSAYANSTTEGTYQQWRLTTTVPNQHYYLNIYTQSLSHNVYAIDYTQTIQIGGGSVVTLDVNDGNAHEISNTVATPPLSVTGAPGSMMNGQYVQIDTE